MAEKIVLRDPEEPDPADLAAERRRKVALLMDEAVSLEEKGFADEGCHRRVRAICEYLGIRPTEAGDGEQG